MIDQTKIYLAYLLDEEAKTAEDPSAQYFLKLTARFIRKEVVVAGVATTFMYPGYKTTEVSLIETNH